jgi:hypothetical protein
MQNALSGMRLCTSPLSMLTPIRLRALAPISQIWPSAMGKRV